jgi:hypothetical protein
VICETVLRIRITLMRIRMTYNFRADPDPGSQNHTDQDSHHCWSAKESIVNYKRKISDQKPGPE